ncbi:hypothetical protein Tco_0063366 [Tanacetum coccineum]
MLADTLLPIPFWLDTLPLVKTLEYTTKGPKGTRIPVKEVVQDAQEQPSKNASPDKEKHFQKVVLVHHEQHPLLESLSYGVVVEAVSIPE